MPIEEVRRALDWNPRRQIQGITVLNDDETDILQNMLTLDPTPTLAEPFDPRAEDAAVDSFDGELERRSLRAQRGEQAALKRRLLPGPIGQCALCGRSLPGTFLVAAHIKKRVMCTDDEKRDLANIAMLACTLGCDAFYEHGYVSIASGGTIQVSPLAAETPDIAAYIDHWLAGHTIRW